MIASILLGIQVADAQLTIPGSEILEKTSITSESI